MSVTPSSARHDPRRRAPADPVSRLAAAAAAALAVAGLAACDASGGSTATDPRLEPTGVPVRFDAARHEDWAAWTAATREHLERFRVALDPASRETEIEAATPFERGPAAGCEAVPGPRRGVVLAHGLSDVPAAMGDLAGAFAERCFVARSILLPGHGARPAELVDVAADDWLAAMRFAATDLAGEVDEVWLGGFSLGGLVATRLAHEIEAGGADARVPLGGVFAFSPAWALEREVLLDRTPWLRRVLTWLDVDPPDDPWRFEAIPVNALAEVQLLARSTREALAGRALEAPVFLAQSADDGVVDAAANRALFADAVTHPKSRLLRYADRPAVTSDARVLHRPGVLPEERVLSYAHPAVHVAPDNPHYGAAGDYRNCHPNLGNRDAEAVERCLAIDVPWRGETFGAATARYDGDTLDTLARLTFNPRFDDLVATIDRFLASLDAEEDRLAALGREAAR